MKKEKKKIIYRGIECDSLEEKYFLMWAFELKEAGYIESIGRAESILTTEGFKISYLEKLKTKEKVKSQTVLSPSEYSPDFKIKLPEFSRLLWKNYRWSPYSSKITQLFIEANLGLPNKNYSIKTEKDTVLIEIKNTYDQNNMTRLFVLNQKFILDKYGIYINLIKIPDLFEKTFLPKEYLKTPSGKDKKINFSYVLIEEYLKNLEK